MPEYTGHSARAGFVSDALLNGMPFIEVKETGHWIQDTTLRVYADAASAFAQCHDGDVAPWLLAGQEIERCPASFLPQLGMPLPTLISPFCLYQNKNKETEPKRDTGLRGQLKQVQNGFSPIFVKH